jgi:hypothetical protein
MHVTSIQTEWEVIKNRQDWIRTVLWGAVLDEGWFIYNSLILYIYLLLYLAASSIFAVAVVW